MKKQDYTQTKGYDSKRLFEPLNIKEKTLRNRIVYPACITSCATPDGFVTKGLIRYYQARAEHAGLTIVECTLPRKKGGGITNQLAIYNDRFIPGLTKLAHAIKEKGSVALIQVGDLGARGGICDGDWDLVVPSKIVPLLGPIEPRVLSTEEIKELVVVFAEAAHRAFEAGFDGVEFHSAHLYLISEFLSPYTNKRIDEYGGSVENRARFLIEIIKETKKRVSEDFLIFCRISMFSPFEGDSTMEDVIKIAQLLEQAGIDALDPSGTCQKIAKVVEGKKYDHLTSTCPSSWPEAHEVKYVVELKKALNIPVVAVGKIYSPQLAENILELKQADLIALGRSLIADPEWPRKVREGREREISRCKEDLKCLRIAGPIQCLVNKSLPPEGIDVLA